MHQIFPRVNRVLEASFEQTVQCCEIIEDYLLLGGELFLSRHLANVLGCLDLLLGNTIPSGQLHCARVLDLLIQVCETIYNILPYLTKPTPHTSPDASQAGAAAH